MRRWPRHLDSTIEASSARLRIDATEFEKNLVPGDTKALFTASLPAGPATIQSWLTLPDGSERGAYFVYVQRRD